MALGDGEFEGLAEWKRRQDARMYGLGEPPRAVRPVERPLPRTQVESDTSRLAERSDLPRSLEEASYPPTLTVLEEYERRERMPVPERPRPDNWSTPRWDRPQQSGYSLRDVNPPVSTDVSIGARAPYADTLRLQPPDGVPLAPSPARTRPNLLDTGRDKVQDLRINIRYPLPRSGPITRPMPKPEYDEWPEAPLYQSQADEYKQTIFQKYPFTPYAKQWLGNNVTLRLQTMRPDTGSGGGLFRGPTNEAMIIERQDEAAIHEMAHGWWDLVRVKTGVSQNFVDTVYKIAIDQPEQYPRVSELARLYMTSPKPVMWGDSYGTREWNDHEIFAGLASGTMGDLRLMPPELRPYYRALFNDPFSLVGR